MSTQVLNQRQARWNISLSCFNFIIMYRHRFQQDQSDALSRRSYLASKERDVAYDQQHSVLLKSKQLLLRTIYTTISVDSIFLTNIYINLLSDLLALKFKQSCVDSKAQNG
jgi:hypothetical protein